MHRWINPVRQQNIYAFLCVPHWVDSLRAVSLFKKNKLSAFTGILILFAFSALLFEDESDLIKSYHQDGQGFATSPGWNPKLAALL